MKRAAVLVAVLVAATGCHNFTRCPGQDEAEAIVWHQVYERDDDPPPVEWVTGDALDCGNATGFTVFDGASEKCVLGIYYEAFGYARVARRDTIEPLHYTAYAHELRHAVVGDPNHAGVDWTSTGIVSRADKALEEAGL